MRVAAALAIGGCGAAQDRAPPAGNAFDSAWARDPLWDDGLAEVSLYDARRPQYDKVEEYQALLIVAKEEMTEDGVKAEPPYAGRDLLPVLKLNAVHGYWTDNYPYHLLVSVFVRRDDPRSLVKASAGRQEWCGNTFHLLDWRGARARLHWHSYFDGYSDGETDPGLMRGDVTEDQLPLVLRGLRFAAGTRAAVRVLPSLLAPDAWKKPTPRPARIAVKGAERVTTGAGDVETWRVEVQGEAVRQTWWLDGRRPHAVVKMEGADGTALLLRERTRKAYWDQPTFRPAE
jgi:hypothetical protein